MCSPEHVEWEYKIWGRVAHVLATDGSAVDCLEVKAGYQCSRHHHADKSNTFLVVSGALCVREWTDRAVDNIPTKVIFLASGQSCTVEPNVDHQFVVIEPGVVVEYYTAKEGQRVRADDIVRVVMGDATPDHQEGVT